MLVGIVVAGMRPEDGGGTAFQEVIVNTISDVSTQQNFIVLDTGEGHHQPNARIPRIVLQQYYERKEPDEGRISNRFIRRFSTRRVGKLMRRILRKTYSTLKRRNSDSDKILPRSLLDRAIEDFGIDMVWFVTPFSQDVSVPFIYTVWDLQHRVKPYFPEVSIVVWGWEAREKLYRHTIPRAALTLTGTEVGKQEIVYYYSPNPANVRVIPFPSPVSEFEIEEKDEDDEEILKKFGLSPGFLFYPAQFWAHKNHANLLHALEILLDTYNVQLEMVFVGSDQGNEDYIKSLAKNSRQKIHFLGFVKKTEIFALYRNAFALVYPSFFGPDNLPPLEAFSLGCPVIAARVDGAEEQLADAAILFDPAQGGDIAAAIALLYEDRQYRAQLIRRGSGRVKGLTAVAYVEKVCGYLDEFENIRNCWG